MFSLRSEVGSRSDSGKLLEIVDEVRLVEVDAAQSNFSPVNITATVDDSHHLLKTLDATKQLRSQPHFLGKQFNESPRAETNLPSNRRDSRRFRFLKFTQRKTYRRMPAQSAKRLHQQKGLHHLDLAPWRGA